MSIAYGLHPLTDKKSPKQPEITEEIANYIVVQPGREAKPPPPFDVLRWLRAFYAQEGLPVLREEDVDSLPDERLQETMEEYQMVTPTVRGTPINLFIEEGVKGFPLVENVKFNVVRSYPAERQYNGEQNLAWIVGNSYYRAVAWCIYGNWELWPHVKAQHAMYLDRVLASKDSPRHALFTKLNETRKGVNNLNLKERLGIPYCAIRHEDIQQVTADLYDIYLVIFTYRPPGRANPVAGKPLDQSERHYAPTIRGEFNRPHKFIRFSIGTMPPELKQYPLSGLMPYWQIYEPMLPAQPIPARPSDFRYIKPTLDNTKASMPSKATKNSVTGTKHPWRRNFAQKGEIYPPLTAGVRVETPGAAELEVALGCVFGDPDDPDTWDPSRIEWIKADEKKVETEKKKTGTKTKTKT